MLALVFSVFFVLAATARSQLCSRGRDYMVLGFDDITATEVPSTPVPWPYNDFFFRRGPSDYVGWSSPQIAVVNTSNSAFLSAFATSPVNVIVTGGMPLVIDQVIAKDGNRTFALQSIVLSSLWVDKMAVYIQMSRANTVVYRQLVTLDLRVRTPVTITSDISADKVVIGCVSETYDTCATILYDDVALCYKKSTK